MTKLSYDILSLIPIPMHQLCLENDLVQTHFNTLKPRQNGRHFADDIFNCDFVNVNVWIPIKISLKFVPKGQINPIPALVQVMAWRRPGDKPLSEPMMVSIPTHICVFRPQWVDMLILLQNIHNEHLGPLLTLIPGWISNYIHYKVWDKST